MKSEIAKTRVPLARGLPRPKAHTNEVSCSSFTSLTRALVEEFFIEHPCQAQRAPDRSFTTVFAADLISFAI